MTSHLIDLTPAELEQYGFARAKDIAFDAIQKLWRRRQKEGMKQAELARAIDWDAGLLSRKLQGPSNWTLRTLGALAEALRGELQINICASEDPLLRRPNYHAYAGYETPDAELSNSATEPGTLTANAEIRAILTTATS